MFPKTVARQVRARIKRYYYISTHKTYCFSAADGSASSEPAESCRGETLTRQSRVKCEFVIISYAGNEGVNENSERGK